MKLNNKEKLSLKVIDTWLDYKSRYSDIPGVQTCIRKKGQLIFSKAYGLANVKTQEKLTTKHIFRMASQSKMFTSCAILQLVQEGRLSLEDKAITYLPELKKHKDKRFKEITVRDLLSHRSGLFRDGLDSDHWDLLVPFPSREKLMKEVMSTDLIYAPNEQTKYSNTGYALLGLIIENVMKQSFSKSINSLIINKLRTNQLSTDYSPEFKKDFASGHSRPFYERQRLPYKHAEADAMAPATGICGNAEDGSLFLDEMLFRKSFLTKEMQKEILSISWPVMNIPNERYGYGMFFESFKGGEVIGHAGAFPGFSTITANISGSETILSFFLNTNEHLPGTAIKSIAKILHKIDSTFTEKEADKATLSPPLMNKWGGLLFILTKTKGYTIPLDWWNPCEDALDLTSKDGKNYWAEKQSGYNSPGQSITFNKDAKGNITSVMWGTYVSMNESDFIKNSKKILA